MAGDQSVRCTSALDNGNLDAASIDCVRTTRVKVTASRRSQWTRHVARNHCSALTRSRNCHRHRCLLRLTPRQVRDDLGRAQAVIADATGQPPRRFRPPYGIFNAAALLLARAHGWEPLLWSKDGRDWQRRATADSIAGRATRGLRGGDVILLHDADHYSAPGSWRQTVAALPHILGAIERQALKDKE